MRRKIRCDCTAEPPGELIDQRDRAGVAHREGALERARDGGERQARPQRRRKADDAGQPHHRHDRDIAAKPRRHQAAQRGRNLFEAEGSAIDLSHRCERDPRSSHPLLTIAGKLPGTTDSRGALSPHSRAATHMKIYASVPADDVDPAGVILRRRRNAGRGAG